jgi:hypothetical protein
MRPLLYILLLFTLAIGSSDGSRRRELMAANNAKDQAAGGGSDPNLIAQWKFNDGSGTSAADATGNGNTGTLQADTTWGTGPNSNGDTVYDGTGDYVIVANEENFDFDRGDAFSVTAWIKPHSSSTGQRDIMTKMAQSGNFHGWIIRYDADNQLLKFILLQSNGAQVIQASTAVNSVVLNTWYSVGFTYSGSSENTGLKLYINGSDVTAAPSGGPLDGSLLTNDAVWIGRGDANSWFGEIDDVRVYDIEMSAGQVSAISSDLAQ